MLIDWFTVGAQTLNFLILVWLLKRFLYQPILDAIDAREQRIAAELANAEQKQTQAQQQLEDYQQKNAVFERQRKQLLQTAVDEAQAEHQRLLNEARQAASALSHKRQQAMQEEQQQLEAEIKRLTCEEVFAVARKALTELAGASLEQCMTDVLLTRLDTLGGDTRQNFLVALADTGQILVRSAFTLPPAQQAAIQNKLVEIFGEGTAACFEIAPNLVSGIELSLNGRKLSWSIEEYLGSLQSHINGLLTTPLESEGLQTEPALQADYINTKTGEESVHQERSE